MVTLLLIALTLQQPAADDRVGAALRAFETAREMFEHELLGLGPDGLDAIGKLARGGPPDVRAMAERAAARIKEDRQTLENLIGELGAAEPEKREAASRMLREAGPGARWYLERARKSTDAEIALRAEVLLARLNRGRAGAAIRAGRLADAQKVAVREVEEMQARGLASAQTVSDAKLLLLHHSFRAGRIDRAEYFREKAALVGKAVDALKRLRDAGVVPASEVTAWTLRAAYVERRLGRITQEQLENLQADALRAVAQQRNAGIIDRATSDRMALEILTDPDEDLE